METFVALLRGINVGGKRKLPMAELKSLLSSLGFEDVVTYIQSGNVVFRGPRGDARELATGIEERITQVVGLDVAVMLRSPAKLAAIVSGNPFHDETDRSSLHVVFLDRAPENEAAARLDPQRSPPDELSLRGAEIYLRLPNGSARTKLTLDYFERTLDARATARNWTTVNKLLELAQG